jgi:ABC-2 type transport system permease protein
LRELVTDLKLRYRGACLGYLWALVRPLGVFAVLCAIFARFLRVGGAVPYFPVSLVLGIVLWNHFAEVAGNARGLRDLGYIWEVIMQGASYATSIIYPLNTVPHQLADVRRGSLKRGRDHCQ